MSEEDQNRQQRRDDLVDQSLRSIVVKSSGFGLAFATTLLLARGFGPTVYGEFRIVMTVVSLVLPFTVWGLNSGLVKFLPRYRRSGENSGIRKIVRTAFGLGLLLTAAGSMALYAGRNAIAANVLHKPELGPLFAVAAALLVPLSLLRIASGLFTACRRPSVSMLHSDVVARALFIAAALVLFFLGRHSGAALVSTYAGVHAVALLLLCCAACRLDLPRADAGDAAPPAVRPFLLYSSTLLFTSFVGGLLARVDTIMIGRYLSMEHVGVYNAATRLCDLNNIFQISIGAIFASVISSCYAAGDWDDIRALLRRVTDWAITLCLPLPICFLWFSESVMTCLGRDYGPGSQCLAIVALSRMIGVLTFGYGGALLSVCGKERVALANTVGMVILNIALNMALIPAHGILGAAIATLITRIVLTMVTIMEARFFFGLHVFDRRQWSLLVNAAAVAATTGIAYRISDHVVSAVAAAAVAMALSCGLSLVFFGDPKGLLQRLVNGERK